VGGRGVDHEIGLDFLRDEGVDRSGIADIEVMAIAIQIGAVQGAVGEDGTEILTELAFGTDDEYVHG
jgi:hypothetical protein